MKLKNFLVCLALLAPGIVQAQNATAISGAGAASQSAAGAISGAGAAAVMENSFNTPANTTSRNTNQNEQHYSGGYSVRSAPNIIAPNILPSVPCASVTSGGLSIMGTGATFGTAHQDDDCNLRETARLLHVLGKVDDAMDVLCASKHAAYARACKERAKVAKAEEAQAVIAEAEHEARLKVMREEAIRHQNDRGRRTEADTPARGMPTRDGFIKPIMLDGKDDPAFKKMTPEEKELWLLKPVNLPTSPE